MNALLCDDLAIADIPLIAKTTSFIGVADVIGVLASFLPLPARLEARLVSSRWDLGVRSSLRALKFKRTILTPQLKLALTSFSEVRSLDLRRCDELSGIPKIPVGLALDLVDLSETKTNNFDLEHLSRHSRLTSLCVRRCRKVSNVGLKKLSTLVGLKSLDVSGCDITDAGLVHLNRWLGHLKLSKCAISNDALEHIALLPVLKSLDVSCSAEISDDGLAHLTRLCGTLVSLDIGHCQRVTNEGVRHIGALKLLTTLNLVALDRIADEGLSFLGELSHLRCLTLDRCTGISEHGLQVVSHFSKLVSLNLACLPALTDEVLKQLRGLKNLEELDLGRCRSISDIGLEYLAGALAKLATLDIQACERVTDEGLRHLARLSGLQQLDVSCVSLITDNGLQHLAHLPQLRTLNASHCYGLTDAITEAAATQFKKLTTLELSGWNGVSSAGVQALRAARPNVAVSFSR